MKKIISICLSFSLFISTIVICNFTAYSNDIDISSFEIYQSGDNEMYIYKYNGDDTELVLDLDYMFAVPVTEIFDNAFQGNTTIEKITISGSIKTIGINAFAGCTNLKEVIMSDSVTEVGEEAFAGCESLTTVTLSNSITEIKSNTFKDCTQLKDISEPNALKIIGDSAFSNCSSLVYFNIPDGVTKIGNRAFYGCKSFYGTSIPESVEQLGGYIFWNCESMERILLPDNLETIPSGMFGNCKSLKEIKLPYSLVKVDTMAFENCSGLYAVYASDLSHWLNISFSSNPLLDANLGYLYLNNNLLKDLVIPDGVTAINNNQFAGCDSIETVTFGNEVKTIGTQAFSQCSNLKEVVLPINIEKLGSLSFYSNGTLETVTVENPDCEITDGAFYKTTLKAPHISTAHDYANKNSSIISFVATDEHEWELSEITQEATCTESGVAVYSCTMCDETKTGEIPATGHNYSESITLPTCTEQGYTTYTCANCGDSYIDNYTDALGHNFVDNEKYCLNGCTKENPDYIAESSTVRDENNITTEENTVVKVSEPTTKSDTDEYKGSKDTDYADFRIIPGYGQIKAAWTADSKIEGYEVYISTDNSKFKKVADINAKNTDYYIIDNLSNGQIYYVKIKGYLHYNGKKISMNSFSNTQSLTVK